jgi:hypothetical protein
MIRFSPPLARSRLKNDVLYILSSLWTEEVGHIWMALPVEKAALLL